MLDTLASRFGWEPTIPDDLFLVESDFLEKLDDFVQATATESAVFDDLAIGLMAIEGQNYTTAVSALSRVTDVDRPKFALAQECLGLAFLKSGQPDLAIEPLHRAIQLNEQLGREPLALAECQFSLGLAYLHSGHEECALSEFQKALHCEPDWGTVLYEIARVHALRNRILESASALDEAGRQDKVFFCRAQDDLDFDGVIQSPAFQGRSGDPHFGRDWQ